ncbi:MAG TPA: FHA domain-containing protein [Polyangiaceae bacterium]|nr:FHA domain-containing protein [Polyangiaceae bacterium]
MIKCAKCGKENQDHYKFCLGCGSELPKNAPKEFQAEAALRPTSVMPQKPEAARVPSVPPAVAAAAAAAPVQAPAPVAAAPAAASAPCPQCGHENATGNRFCAACGYKLGGAAPAAAAAAPAPAAAGSGVVLTALRADGSEAGRFELPAGPSITVGRDTGTIFAGDSYLSPRHATFDLSGGKLSVRDESSLNGVYIKLVPGTPFHLEPGAVFRIGQEIVRFEKLETLPPVDGVERFGSPAKGIVGRLALVIGRDTTGNAFPVPQRGLHLGRERGDVLFSEDGYVSGLHCRVAPGDDGNVYLTDVGSSNGTFVRVRDNHPIGSGDILLMGQQVFRVDF